MTAKRNKITLSFQEVSKMNLNGDDVFAKIQEQINLITNKII